MAIEYSRSAYKNYLERSRKLPAQIITSTAKNFNILLPLYTTTFHKLLHISTKF